MVETDMSLPAESVVHLPDGRTLAYAIYGATDADLPTLFYFHGSPGAHQEALMFHSTAAAHDVRIIAISRPGHGGSSFQVDRTLLSWPADVLALADALDVRHFGVLGTSGGGPYVLACLGSLGKTIPKERLLGAGIVCGLYPTYLGLQGMLKSTRIMFAIARTPIVSGVVGPMMDLAMGRAARDSKHPEKFANMLTKAVEGLPAQDRKVFETNEGRSREALTTSLRDAFREGGNGAGWEARLFARDWGFKLEDVPVSLGEKGKLVMWHGTEDVNVPVAMAQKAVVLMPGAELRVVEGEAHASMPVRKVEEIILTVKAMVGR